MRIIGPLQNLFLKKQLQNFQKRLLNLFFDKKVVQLQKVYLGVWFDRFIYEYEVINCRTEGVYCKYEG